MAAKPDIPLPIIVTHDENDLGGPLLVLQNLWPEKGKPQTNVPYTLHNMPGVTQLFASIAGLGASMSGPTGIFSRDGLYNGTTIVFTYGALYYEGPSDISPMSLPGTIAPVTGGTYETNGTRSTEHASIRQFLAWVEGTTAVAMDSGGNVAPIAGIPATVIDVASIGKRFYFADGADDTIHFTDLDTANYNALNTFQGEVVSDTNQSLYAHANNLYIASSTTIEIHRPVPDPDLPMSYTGVVFPFGAPAPAAWADTIGHCFTIGQTPSGARGVYKISGGTYEKISPHWLDRRLELLDESNYPDLVNLEDIASIKRCIGNAYTNEGHSVYELYIPGVVSNDGVNGDIDYPPLTIAYDVTSGAWIEITSAPATASAASAQITSVSPRWHGVDQRFNRHYVIEATTQTLGSAEPTDGRWGEMTRKDRQYFGSDQPWQWCAFQATDRVFEIDDIVQQLNVVEPDPAATTKAGQFVKSTKAALNAYSPDAGALYDVSDDLGMTFSPPRTVTFNFHNKHGHYLASRRGGEARQPGRIHRWRLNYPGNIQVGPMFINIGPLE